MSQKNSNHTGKPAEVILGAVARDLGITWKQPFVRGIVAIIAAVLMITWPQTTVVVVVSLLGIFAVADGILTIFDGVGTGKDPGQKPVAAEVHVAAGALMLLAGIVLLVWPGPTVLVFSVLFGLFTLAAGLVAAWGALRVKNSGVSHWVWALAYAGLTIVVGLVFLLSPKTGITVFVWVFALYALLFGAVLIGLSLKMKAGGQAIEEHEKNSSAIDV